MNDALSNACFELQPNAEFNEFALFRAVLEVGRGERLGMDGGLSLQTAILDEVNWYSFCMNHLLLLTVFYYVALLQVDPRSCHDTT